MAGKEIVKMDKLIEAKNIMKSFGDNVVLDGLDLEIEPGEIVALIGPSGCGKSTLVRCISGLEKVQSGEVTVDQKRVENVKSNNGKIGMVFQSFNLFPHLTVIENIANPCRVIKKMTKAASYELAEKLLEKVHLEEKAKQYPANLSGGQKQRVAIARALAMEPEILIFDEPTSSLDPELAHEVFASIRDLAKEGQTMIIVTHQINAVKQFATRVVFLNHGKVKQDGTPEYIFDECQDPELKKFLKMVDFVDLNE